MFDTLDIVKGVKTYTAIDERECKDKYDRINFYVIFFNLEIDGKYVYIVFAEPYFFGLKDPIESNYAAIEIKELNFDVLVETDTPKATFRKYSIQDEPMEDCIMLSYLLSEFLDLEEYSIIDEPDILFIK